MDEFELMDDLLDAEGDAYAEIGKELGADEFEQELLFGILGLWFEEGRGDPTAFLTDVLARLRVGIAAGMYVSSDGWDIYTGTEQEVRQQIHDAAQRRAAR